MLGVVGEEDMMSSQFPDFMHLDLSKLTLAGWLLMLLTLATVVGVFVLVGLVLHLLGFEVGSGNRVLAVIVVVCGLAAGAGVFQGGRMLLDRIGVPILRS
jgi:hypothetical protein